MIINKFKFNDTYFEIIEHGNTYHVEKVIPDSCSKNYTELKLGTLPHLQSKVLIIDSTLSGRSETKRTPILHDLIEPTFQILEIDYAVKSTESSNSIGKIGSSWDEHEDTFSSVIFLSGDTSINEFINGLLKTQGVKPVWILPFPCGTGNSLALSIDINTCADAITKFLTGKSAPLNLYEAQLPTGSYLSKGKEKQEIRNLYFLVVLSWGLHAALVADSDSPEMRKLGVERFKHAAKTNIDRAITYQGTTEIMGRQIDGPYTYWLLCATKKFEPLFTILPLGDVAENSLYMVLVPYMYHNQLMEIMQEVYDGGSHVNDERVTYSKVSGSLPLKLLAKSLHNSRLCADGAIILLPETDCEITVYCCGNLLNGRPLHLVC